MVLRGDRGERVRLIAIAIEIGLRELPENTRKAALDRVLLLTIAGAEQDIADLGAADFGHFLNPDDESETGAAGRDRVQPLMDRGRTGGAGVLDPVAGLKRKPGSAWNTSEAGNSWRTKPPFIVPR